MKPANTAFPLLLSGRVVQPDGRARPRYLLIRDGRIAWSGVGRPSDAIAAGAREVSAGARGWIFPGLLNLHTHAAYNVLPLWHAREAPFGNRFDWRADAGYKVAIPGRIAALKAMTGAEQTLAIVSELQAIAGGTTVLDQSNRLDTNAPVEEQIVLCRDTGDASDLGMPPDRRLDSIVDFFAPGPDGRPAPKTDFKTGRPVIDLYAEDRDAGRLAATLVHLAEGRSGFGSGRGVDPYSRAEFEAFAHHPALADAGKVRAVPLSLVHASGLDTTNRAHLQFLADRRISIVWSPVSNLLLYGDTIDVERLVRHGINVALGSDWSPSGSKHVWDEAKFARRYLAAIGSTLSDADVFRMVTTSAARCLGSGTLGRLEEGAHADLFILDSPIDTDSALEVFFATDDEHVLATMVNGVPIYGRASFLRQFELPIQPLPSREGRAAAGKAVHLPSSIDIDLAGAIDAVEDRLKALDPPVRRSNLLASSDKPYQRRMQRLRAHVEWFGWTAKQTAKQIAQGRPSMNGRVPVPPDAVRVWCGFKNGGGVRDFLDRLGGVIVPSTVMLMRELGLTAYFPAIPPIDHPAGCPDKVAIAFYESQETYADAARSVGGRTWGLLRDSVFRGGNGHSHGHGSGDANGRGNGDGNDQGDDGGGSWEAFPEPLSAAPFRARAAYHVFDEAIDWYGGLTRVCIGVREPAQPVAAFHDGLLAVCRGLRASPGAIDGALIAVGEEHFVFWDHREAAAPPDDERHLDRLAACGRVLMCTQARDTNANGQLFETWSGFSLQGGECLRLTFERRSLFPW